MPPLPRRRSSRRRLQTVAGATASAAAVGVEVLFLLPLLGAALRWGWGLLTHVLWLLVSVPDALLWSVGVRPPKRLRVQIVILRDEQGIPVASPAYARSLFALAAEVYRRDANVRLVAQAPYVGPAADATGDLACVRLDPRPSPRRVLDLPCNARGALTDWLLAGSTLQRKTSTLCFDGAWRRLLGYGAPVVCYVVRSLPGRPPALGCALWITGYATIKGDTQQPPRHPRTLAHELGHACNLWHTCVESDPRNLMATRRGTPLLSPCRGRIGQPAVDAHNPRLNTLQALLVRMSKHVTYL